MHSHTRYMDIQGEAFAWHALFVYAMLTTPRAAVDDNTGGSTTGPLFATGPPAQAVDTKARVDCKGHTLLC